MTEQDDTDLIVSQAARIVELEAKLRVMVEIRAALEMLVAADNCNYERDTMRREGYFEDARVALRKARRGTAL